MRLYERRRLECYFNVPNIQQNSTEIIIYEDGEKRSNVVELVLALAKSRYGNGLRRKKEKRLIGTRRSYNKST